MCLKFTLINFKGLKIYQTYVHLRICFSSICNKYFYICNVIDSMCMWELYCTLKGNNDFIHTLPLCLLLRDLLHNMVTVMPITTRTTAPPADIIGITGTVADHPSAFAVKYTHNSKLN